MTRYPPSTIYRYLELPSTQRIRTHISHTPPTPLIHSTSAALDTIPEPSVPPTCPAVTTTTPSPSPTPALPSPSHPCTLTLSQYTYMQPKQQYTYHSHRNHRIHIGFHDNLTDRPKTTT